MSRRRRPRFTPRQFYDAWPNADLLPIERPPVLMSGQEFRRYIEDLDTEGRLGDTLLLFMAREFFGEQITQEELYSRAVRAEADVHQMVLAVEAALSTSSRGAW